MNRLWVFLLLACLVGASRDLVPPAAVEIVTVPPGAAVRWSRADSPLMHDAGRTPCRVELPAHAGCVVELTLPGYLPVFRTLKAGDTRFASTLTPWRDELAEPLSDNADLPEVAILEGLVDHHWDRFVEPTADGAGVYELRDLMSANGQPCAIWWRPFGGKSELLMVCEDVHAAAFRQQAWPIPALSPDGRWLAIALLSSNELWIELRARSGGAPRRLVTYRDVLPSNPVWSPDGRWLYYCAGVPDGKDHFRRALHRVEVESGRDERLADCDDCYAAPTADGREIAYYSGGRACILDLETHAVRVMTQAIGSWDTPHALQWSPDGQWLACPKEIRIPRGGRTWEIGLVARDKPGYEDRQIARARYAYQWLPDSSGLIVAGRIYGLDGHLRRYLGSPLGMVESMAWQPDSHGLFVIALDAAGQRRTARLGLDGALTLLDSNVVLPDGLRWWGDSVAQRFGAAVPGSAAPPVLSAQRLRVPALAAFDDMDAHPAAVASPDGKQLAALLGGYPFVAPAEDPEHGRRLHDPSHRRYGPCLYLARSLPAAAAVSR